MELKEHNFKTIGYSVNIVLLRQTFEADTTMYREVKTLIEITKSLLRNTKGNR